MPKTIPAGRRKPASIAAARKRLMARLAGLRTGDMKRIATTKAPWQTIWRIATGRTPNPHVEVLEEIERRLG